MRLILLQPVLSALDDSGNREAIRRILADPLSPPGGGPSLRPDADDIVLLPEHFIFTDDPGAYDAFVAETAALAGCTVVGGSHHRRVDGKRVNYGAVVGPDGTTIARYSKLRPYFNEAASVVPGDAFGEFRLGGRNILVLVCADFWYSDLVLRAKAAPDIILVPALSVTRKPDPYYSRALWRHLAVARAYEFGAYVGISDWDDASSLPKYRTSGVAGLADPVTTVPGRFFTSVDAGGATMFDLDFPAIEAFREDRRMRGFFWK
jgi:predicted amidohydrolase